jgi:hypothetical protein
MTASTSYNWTELHSMYYMLLGFIIFEKSFTRKFGILFLHEKLLMRYYVHGRIFFFNHVRLLFI